MRARVGVWTLWLIILGSVGACQGGGPDGRLVALFGGPSPWSAVEAPDEVEAYRLKGAIITDPAQHIESNCTAGPLPLDETQRKRIRAILTSPDTYMWDMAKACEPLPGVALVFTRSQQSVQVLLCYECKMLTVVVAGKVIGSEDFDFGHTALVALAQELFPDDPDIQALK